MRFSEKEKIFETEKTIFETKETIFETKKTIFEIFGLKERKVRICNSKQSPRISICRSPQTFQNL